MTGAGASSVVFRNAEVEVLYQAGRSDFLLVTFAEMGMRPNGAVFWGQPIASRLGLSALGIVACDPNWFPATAIEAALRDPGLAEVLAGHPVRLLYGFSMGGYAVLKYGRRLKARATISVAPQYSITPAVTGGHDWRFSRFHDAGQHADMEITAGDVAANSFVVADPRERQDRWNLDRIMAAAPQVQRIDAVSTGHYTAQALASSGCARDMFAAALAADGPALRRTVRQKCRSWPRRPLLAVRQLLDRHPALALPLLDRHRADAPSGEVGWLYAMIGQNLARAGAVELAETAVGAALHSLGEPTQLTLQVSAEIAFLKGDPETAKTLAQSAIDLDPDRPGPRAMLDRYRRLSGA